MWCDAMCDYLFFFLFHIWVPYPISALWKICSFNFVAFPFQKSLTFSSSNSFFAHLFIHFIIKCVTIYVYSAHTVCYFNNFSCLTISDDKVIRQHATNKISSFSNEERKWNVQCSMFRVVEEMTKWENRHFWFVSQAKIFMRW